MKKFRLVYVANYIQYKEIEAKDKDEAEELLCESDTTDGTWKPGKDYSESYIKELKEEK